MPATESHKLHPIRIVIAVILGIILLGVAIILYHHNHSADTGAQPIEQTQPGY